MCCHDPSIATSSLDKNGHIRGDTPSSAGDSGGGCFSVVVSVMSAPLWPQSDAHRFLSDACTLQTGKLLAINVGRENVRDRSGASVPGSKSVLVPIASVVCPD